MPSSPKGKVPSARHLDTCWADVPKSLPRSAPFNRRDCLCVGIWFPQCSPGKGPGWLTERPDPGGVAEKDPCFFSGGSYSSPGGDGGGAGSALGPCAPLWIVHGSIHADTRPPALRALYGHSGGIFQRLKLSPAVAGIMLQDGDFGVVTHGSSKEGGGSPAVPAGQETPGHQQDRPRNR